MADICPAWWNRTHQQKRAFSKSVGVIGSCLLHLGRSLTGSIEFQLSGLGICLIVGSVQFLC